MTTWLAPNTSKAYTQGNITASLYSMILKGFILFNPKFVKVGSKRKDNNREEYHDDKVRFNLSFAFYDDNGIPCGVNISYSTLDPELWTAAIIRNTTTEPELRKVLIISPEDIIDAPEDKLTAPAKAADFFLNFLQSKQIKKLLTDVFLADGTVNLQSLKTLQPRYVPKQPEDQKRRLTTLRWQEGVVKKWMLTEAQFQRLKIALEQKQQQNLRQAHAWYESVLLLWHEEKMVITENRLKNLHKPLDKKAKQSFLQRHVNFKNALVNLIILMVLFSVILICAMMEVISAGMATLFLVGVGAAIAGLMVRVGMRVHHEEEELSAYQQQLAMETEVIIRSTLANYQRKLQEINTKIDISHLKQPYFSFEILEEITKEAGINIENKPEQVQRAVLAADFTSEEFTKLCKSLQEMAQIASPVSASNNELPGDVAPWRFSNKELIAANISLPGTRSQDPKVRMREISEAETSKGPNR
ncbi:hypothetical protein [Legionella lansingensis]|uniref:hypothetical protein n=1 Tax=Legionella lansingensis TaxID=45067 RepID=UPI001041062B|nr:hypothetical protein [Legionella lansingensis]